MKRPCGCDSCVIGEPWVARRDCRHCWLYWNDPRYRRLWNEPADAPTVRNPAPAPIVPAEGPGTELKAILTTLGFAETSASCGCEQMAAQMNVWSVDGCRSNLGTIIDWLRKAAEKVKAADKISAAGKGLVAGIFLNPADLYGSLARLAIRRAERKLNKD